MNNPIKTIGILGAGKVGIVLAQLALKAGYSVLIAGSGEPDKIALTVKVLAPGAVADTKENVASSADVVILALPLSKFPSIPKDALAGKIVIDAMNHWPEVDGPRTDTIPNTISSSEAIQTFLKDSIVVKGFSHTGYHELYDTAHHEGIGGRKAIAVASDDANAIETVSVITSKLGFDPLPIGTLADGAKLEPGQPAFGANLTRPELNLLLLEKAR